MPGILEPIAHWIRSSPTLRRAGRGASGMIPDIRYTVKVPQLGPIRIRLRRHRWMLYENFLATESYTLGLFQRMTHPGDVVYDVGANIGLYSRVFITWLKADRVIAFEPMTENLELLRANVELSGEPDRFVIHPLALSDIDGEEELQIDDITSGTAVLNSVSGGEASAGRKHHGLTPVTESVKVMKLDSFLCQHDIRPPDVIKIDTEGAEAKVIAGATQTLTRHRPRLIIATHGPDKVAACVELLDGLGYYTYGFVRGTQRDDDAYRRLTPEDADSLGNTNICSSTDETDVCEPIQNMTTVPG